MRKSKLLALLAAALCVMALARPASAAQTGSIRVTLDEPGVQIRLHYVAGPDGCLVKEFAGAGIEPEALLDTKQSPQNARTLCAFAASQEISGTGAVTDESGAVTFPGLAQGCYLVYPAGTEAFEPFLVFLPTQIGGELVYDVAAEPKSGLDPTDPTEATQPVTPEPQIPQTGSVAWPKYALLAGGTVLVCAGAAEWIRGRKEDE